MGVEPTADLCLRCPLADCDDDNPLCPYHLRGATFAERTAAVAREKAEELDNREYQRYLEKKARRKNQALPSAEQSRLWRQNNPERAGELRRAWAKTHRAQENERINRWKQRQQEKDPEAWKERTAQEWQRRKDRKDGGTEAS